MNNDNKFEKLESKIMNAATLIPVGESTSGWNRLSKELSKVQTTNTNNWRKLLRWFSSVKTIALSLSVLIGVGTAIWYFKKPVKSQEQNSINDSRNFIQKKSSSAVKKEKQKIIHLQNEISPTESEDIEVIIEKVDTATLTPVLEESTIDSTSEDEIFIIW